MNPRLWPLVLGVVLAGCIDSLDPSSIVTGPRVLGIVADPPEAHPGEVITVHALLGGMRGTPRTTWVACVAPEASGLPFGLPSFGTATSESGCFGDAAFGLAMLGEGATARVWIPPGVLDNLPLLIGRLGGNLSPATVQQITQQVGLVFSFGLTVEVDGRTVRAMKRVVISNRVPPNRNPPAPRLTFNGVPVGPRAGDPETCEATGGGAITARPGQAVDLAPTTDESTWAETYPVLTTAGELIERREIGFYSWFATAGSFNSDLTQSPARDNRWTAPAAAGPQNFWVILRDGHGGTSGCRFEVRVGTSPGP